MIITDLERKCPASGFEVARRQGTTKWGLCTFAFGICFAEAVRKTIRTAAKEFPQKSYKDSCKTIPESRVLNFKPAN